MNARPGTLLAVGVMAAALTFGMLALVIGRVDMGVQLEQDGAYVRIASVANNSPAQLEGFVPGMIVVSINNTTLLRLPQYTYPDVTPAPVASPGSSPSTLTSASPAVSPSSVASTAPTATSEATPTPESTPTPEP